MLCGSSLFYIVNGLNVNDIPNESSFRPDVLKEISSFLNIAPRYRFAFVRNTERLCGMPSVNVGHEVAAFIHENEHTDIKAECFSFIKQLISKHTQNNSEIGKYIYLTNIGILFEPEIGLDVNMFLTNLSRNTMLILDWNGEVKYPYLYFLHSGSKHKINLSQLNYITI